MDTQRLILFFIFSFSLLLLWDAWEKHNRPKPVPPAPTAQSVPAAPAKPAPSPSSLPAASPAAASPAAASATVPAAAPLAKGEVLRIKTDLLLAEIDTLGGTLTRVELLKHKEAGETTKNLVLLGAEHQYFAQSGLAGEGGPNHRSLWQALPGPRELAPGQDKLEVRLRAQG